jgi:hypothetical protein
MGFAAKRFAAPAVALLVMAAVFGVARGDSAPKAPGAGLLCAWAMLSVVSEVGDQCFAGQDRDFQSQVRIMVAQMDAYVAANQPATPEMIASFHKDQGLRGAPASTLCQGDLPELYKHVRDQGVGKLHAVFDEMISRPGKPTWDTCT